MIFLLITFLVIALVVTIAGLILSAKMHVSADRATYYSERASYGVAVPVHVRGAYRTAGPVRVPRYVVQEERYTGVGGWMPTWLGGIYGRRADGSMKWPAIIIILLATFLLALYLLLGLLPSHPLIGFLPFYGNSAGQSNQNSWPQIRYGASTALVRLGQLDPAQYDTTAQFNTWAYAACSAAAMTEVINAYGHHYRIIDILQVESRLKEITPASGLLEGIGIQRTVAQFGFKTTLGNNLSLDQVIDIANHGQPVRVDFPPDKYAGGHLLVVLGGNADNVYLADSSLYNRHSLTRAQFMSWWGGFSAIVTPQ
jgi:hypothetical protein